MKIFILFNGQNFENSISVFDFGLSSMKNLNALNFEGFVFLANSTNLLECWSLAANSLLEQNSNENFKISSQLKAFFSKRLSKNSELWYTNYLDEFFESKLNKSMNFSNQMKNFDSPLLNSLNANRLIKKIEILADFFCKNFQMMPISIDFREVIIFF